MKTIWNKKTGEAKQVEAVDAREILARSPDIYTDVDPEGGDGEGGGSDLSKMKVEDLKAYAAEHSIDLGDATKKADILKAIEAGQTA